MIIRRGQIAFVVGGIVAVYMICFASIFDVLGDPVRTEDGHWLGPAKRVNPEVTDIGKIYVYNGKGMFSYRLYRPLCVVWLYVMGFS